MKQVLGDLAKEGHGPTAAGDFLDAEKATPIDGHSLLLTLRATGMPILEAVDAVEEQVPGFSDGMKTDPEYRAATAEMLMGDLYWEGSIQAMMEDDPCFANAVLRLCDGSRLETSSIGWSDIPIDFIPEGILNDGELYLDGCDAIKALPAMRGLDRATARNCRGIERIAQDFEVKAWINLEGCSALRELPSGLGIPEYLDLNGCESLRSLPEGLCIGTDLYLKGCTSWDGIIPQDANIGDQILTDLHPDGVTLDEWRKRYGNKSCFGGAGS